MTRHTYDEPCVDWQGIIEKYLLIKKLYIECEETDEELKTNLQPMNEFRHCLDHVLRLLAKEKDVKQDDLNSAGEEKMLIGHLRRAFFDVCDHLSINYRKKIIDILTPYDYSTITAALPNYYLKTRARIDEINSTIAKNRLDKGQNMQKDDALFDVYSNIVIELKDIYSDILQKIPALDEIHKRQQRETLATEKRQNKWLKISLLVTGGIGILSIIATIIVAIVR